MKFTTGGIEKIITHGLFLGDLSKYSDKKYVLVEGNLDRTFFINLCQHYDVYNTKFYSIEHINIKTKLFEHNDQKNNLLSIFYDPFSSENIKEYNFYGIIDKDFEFDKKYDRIYTYDTHDLETQLIFLDGISQTKLNIDINKEIIEKAMYMTYQLAIIKYYAQKESINITTFSPADYKSYFNGLQINCIKTINKMCKNKKTADYVTKVLLKSKLFDKNGTYNISLNDFINNEPNNLWDMINGHDFLKMLVYLTQSPENWHKYDNMLNGKLNRPLEEKLINSFNYNLFKNTKLYSDMKNVALL